jgi:hypothetical protein
MNGGLDSIGTSTKPIEKQQYQQFGTATIRLLGSPIIPSHAHAHKPCFCFIEHIKFQNRSLF